MKNNFPCPQCGKDMTEMIDRLYDETRHLSEALYYCDCVEVYLQFWMPPVCVIDNAESYHFE